MKTQIYFELESDGDAFKPINVKRRVVGEKDWTDIIKCPAQVFQQSLQQFGFALFIMDNVFKPEPPKPAAPAEPKVDAPK
jgi:hypothetical protein